MLVLTSIFIAEIKSHESASEPRNNEVVLARDESAFEGARELISMYEGKNRVDPID
jgi:hypothetical protein